MKRLTIDFNAFTRARIADDPKYPMMRWETMSRIPFGSCDHYSFTSLPLLRSKGVPVVTDFTPHWACRRMGHTWNLVITETGRRFPFDPAGTLPGQGFRLNEKLSKVYRHTYVYNEDLLAMNQHEEHVPSLFKTLFIKDVTSEYIKTADVKVKTGDLVDKHKFAFCAIFGDFDWTPIAYGKIDGKTVEYKDLGKNTLYTPFTYTKQGELLFFGHPFVVLPNGKYKSYKVNHHKKQTMVLKQKYPALEYATGFLKRLDSCEFQASNDADFKHYTAVHRILRCSANGASAVLPDSVPAYRYWRFFSTNKEAHANVAEIYFYNAQGKAIYGKVIGTEGSWDNNPSHMREAAFDRDILTFFDAPDGEGSWVGMDFGKPTKISQFYYYPRADGNAIAPNDTYELLYWNNGRWDSLGKQKAASPQLVYKNVPSGGIYLLKNHTRGQEVRAFTYEKGQQIWW